MNAFPGVTILVTTVFCLAILTTVVGALIAVLTTRLIRSVCGLALCCVGLAGIYYFLHSPFLALMQILIYVGAVGITIVFSLMLAEPDEPPPGPATPGSRVWMLLALGGSVGLGWAVARLGVEGAWQVPAARVTDGSLRAIGIALLTRYSVAFEVMSVLLLVAILGALAIARGGRDHP